ncbi:hypothetical protein ACFQ21_00265 [Ohtaekwangia kribbensis]|uniref:Uncharacterized protein n=1 Tax=Ohtaekwangia kribbensis TaxID=688913 RepID=A0ABW3JXR5_9BACT
MNANTIDKNVQCMFNITEEELFFLRLDNGIAYLNKRFEYQPDIVEALKNHSKFWKWWNDLWTERDKNMLENCERRMDGIVLTVKERQPIGICVIDQKWIDLKDSFEFYSKYHKPERIKFYPNHVLIDECVNSLTPETTF